MLDSDNNPGAPGQADDKGRFRLNPPAGKLYTINATAPEGQPYLRLETTFKWPKGAVRHEVTLAMKRDVLIRGHVTDATTGRPISGAIIHNAAFLWIHYATSSADGVFQTVVAPGRGHLLVKGPNNDYIAREVTDGDLSGGKPYFRNYPDAVIPFDVKADSEVHEVTAKLRRGVTIQGRLLRPDGKPVAEAVLLCWNQLQPTVYSWFGAAQAARDGQFELRGCDPEQTYPVHFLDAKNELGATVKLSAKEVMAKPVTVRLEPCGKAVARFVDKEGKPLTGFRPLVYFVARPDAKKQGLSDQADSDFAANVDRLHYGPGLITDGEGRCTFPALIPGATYRVLNYNLESVKDFSAKSGETLKLGDIVIARPQ